MYKGWVYGGWVCDMGIRYMRVGCNEGWVKCVGLRCMRVGCIGVGYYES